MNDRDKIFSAIRSALAPLPERTPKPDWEVDLAVCHPTEGFDDLKARFAAKLAFASARSFDCLTALAELLHSEGATFGYCDPALASHFGKLDGITFDTHYEIEKIDDYAFGITRGTAGIAESGTIMLRDVDTSARLAALAPWIHIAVLEERDIVATIPEAIELFGDDPSVIFCTGPSKTADVEGILIEGVHGPGVQIAFII